MAKNIFDIISQPIASVATPKSAGLPAAKVSTTTPAAAIPKASAAVVPAIPAASPIAAPKSDLFGLLSKPIAEVATPKAPALPMAKPQVAAVAAAVPAPKQPTNIYEAISAPISSVTKPSPLPMEPGLSKEQTDAIIKSGGSVIGPKTDQTVPFMGLPIKERFKISAGEVFPKNQEITKGQREGNFNIRIPYTGRSATIPNPLADKLVTGGKPRINQAFNVAINLPGTLVQAIPTALVTLKNEATGFGKAEKKDLGGFESAIYGRPEYSTVNQDIKDRIANGDGILSSFIGAISQKTLDVAFGAQMAALGFRSLSRVLAPGDSTAQIEAWKTLGSPKTEAELMKNYRQLAQQFHPDLTGGSDETIKIINQARQILADKGIPSSSLITKQTMAKYLDVVGRETRLGDGLLKPDLGTKPAAQAKDLNAPRIEAPKAELGKPTTMKAEQLKSSEYYPSMGKDLPLSDSEFASIAKENPQLVQMVKDGKAPPIPVRELPNGLFEPNGDGATRLIIAKHLGIKDIPVVLTETLDGRTAAGIIEAAKPVAPAISTPRGQVVAPAAAVSKAVAPVLETAAPQAAAALDISAPVAPARAARPEVPVYAKRAPASIRPAPTPEMPPTPPTAPGEAVLPAEDPFKGITKENITPKQQEIQAQGMADALDAANGKITPAEFDAKLKDLEARLRATLPQSTVGANIPKTGDVTGKYGPNITIEKMDSEIKKLFSPEELKVFYDPALFKDTGNLGMYKPGGTYGTGNLRRSPVIRLYEQGGRTSDLVGYHEAFHTYFNEFTTAAERQAVLSAVRKNPGTLSRVFNDRQAYKTPDALAEEWIADDFARYLKGPQQYKGMFRQIWEKLAAKIRDMIRRATKLDRLYKDIVEKRRIANPEPTRAVRAKAGLPEKMPKTFDEVDAYLKKKYPDGITLYHQTTPEAAAAIKSGGFKGDGNDEVFFSVGKFDEARNASGKGEVIEIKLSPEDYAQIAPDPGGAVGDSSESQLANLVKGGLEGADVVIPADVATRALNSTAKGKTPLPEKAAQAPGQPKKPELEGGKPGEGDAGSTEKAFSYAKDISDISANSKLNVDNLNISAEGKALVEKTVEEVKPQIEKAIGKVLSNKEAIELAESSSKILEKAVTREKTLEWEAALLRARQKLAQSAESGVVDREFVDNLIAVKTFGTDIGRKLQSFSIGADPKDINSKQAIVEAVLKVTDDAEAIIKKAEGVDFTNLKEATDFYRQFVAPTKTEWIDLIRYNSMLSSPNTHIINVFSNALNTALVAPIEKSITGGLDWLASKVTGRDRSAFGKEGAVYLANYFKSLGDATNRFGGVMKGTRTFQNLDTRFLPIATSGPKGKIVSALSLPSRMLEGMDQFFTALAEGGQKAALQYRKAKGGKVGNIETEAADDAAYRLYRQGLHNEKQGPVLDAIDHVTGKIQALRNSENPIVSTIAKFTVPFLQTPMNIFKQGIEYSPVGVSTIPGAKNKTEQVSKAILGSAVFGMAATLLMGNRLTWGEPISEDRKNTFRAAGKQPYSVKIGDTWYSYQKLPPPLAFPFAMVASLDDLIKNKKITQDNADLVLSAISKYGQFLADQSYMKSIGDLATTFKGGEDSLERLISNYPQQLIPYRALGGWLSRLFDGTQRKIDKDGSFVDKQVQLLMMNIPGLSQKVPARVGPDGEAIPQPNRFANLFSPIKMSTENEKGKQYDDLTALLTDQQNSRTKKAQDAEALYAEIKAMPEGEGTKRALEIKKEDPELFAKIKGMKDAEAKGVTGVEKLMLQLGVENGARAEYIFKEIMKLPDSTARNAYYSDLKKKGVVTRQVDAQISRLRSQK